MSASAFGFNGRLSTLRATRARTDALWHALDGVASNDRSAGRTAKTEALLREISAAEREAQDAMLAAYREMRHAQRALQRARWMLYAVVMLLVADAGWLYWRWLLG